VSQRPTDGVGAVVHRYNLRREGTGAAGASVTREGRTADDRQCVADNAVL